MSFADELLTIEELAGWLKISPRSARELCRDRNRARQKHPIPVLRIGRAVRFSRAAIEQWLKRLEEAQ
jgi:excisionase family DNA binding protein